MLKMITSRCFGVVSRVLRAVPMHTADSLTTELNNFLLSLVVFFDVHLSWYGVQCPENDIKQQKKLCTRVIWRGVFLDFIHNTIIVITIITI